MKRNLLSALGTDGGGGAGGSGGPDLSLRLDTLPEDIRGEASLLAIKTIPDLAKSYVHAQKLIGQQRLPMPQEGWEQKQWDDFYGKLGRPETPEKYGLPDFKPKNENVKIDEAAFGEIRKTIHGLGLTDKQFKGVMSVYLNSLDQGVTKVTSERQTQTDAAMGALRQEWGQNFGTNLDVAKSVLRKFAGEGADELVGYLDESGLGNNVKLVKFLHSVGAAMLEDNTRGGEAGTGLQITDEARAKSEIDRLKTDQEFMKSLMTAQVPGHDEAVKRWMNLHSVAFPGRAGE